MEKSVLYFFIDLSYILNRSILKKCQVQWRIFRDASCFQHFSGRKGCRVYFGGLDLYLLSAFHMEIQLRLTSGCYLPLFIVIRPLGYFDLSGFNLRNGWRFSMEILSVCAFSCRFRGFLEDNVQSMALSFIAFSFILFILW